MQGRDASKVLNLFYNSIGQVMLLLHHHSSAITLKKSVQLIIRLHFNERKGESRQLSLTPLSIFILLPSPSLRDTYYLLIPFN